MRQQIKLAGFTLIELLTVIAVIGILVLFAIPNFSSTTDSARRTSIKADLRNYITAQEVYFADNQTYTIEATLQGAPYYFQLSPGNVFTASEGDASSWSVTIENDSIAAPNICSVTVDGSATSGDITCI